jgi:hypothetical protein
LLLYVIIETGTKKEKKRKLMRIGIPFVRMPNGPVKLLRKVKK